jgi:hypothetical protein
VKQIVVLDLATGIATTPDGHRCNVYDDDRRRIVETLEPVFGGYEVVDGEHRERMTWTQLMRLVGYVV